MPSEKRQVIVAGQRPSDRSALALFLPPTHRFSFEGEGRREKAHCVFYDKFCHYFCALGINWYCSSMYNSWLTEESHGGVSTVSYLG